MPIKGLSKPRRCHNHADGLQYDYAFGRDEKFCPNYVNTKKPRKAYWQRPKANKMCWAYVCDWCHRDLVNGPDWDGWPTGDDGKFIGSMECSLP